MTADLSSADPLGALLGGDLGSGSTAAELDPDEIYEVFLDWAADHGWPLYPHQEEALLEIVGDSNLIVATPTGSGKSLIATAALFAALATGRRAFYTAPIKALVSERFFDLVAVFGAERVGMITGDSAVNPEAPIICCTAEILASAALRSGAATDAQMVVMDEFHYYGDPQRGVAWQIPVIELPAARFVLMSATLGDVDFFAKDLTRRTGAPTAVITGVERPVPLRFSYELVPLQEMIEELLNTHRAPVYVVHFTQAAALERAQSLTSITVATRAERDEIAELIGDFRFSAGFGKTLSRLVRHGIGVHHAGMLPKYRRLVEKLTQSGLLKVICGTDTLGVGINVPIRTVLLTGLAKYDGVRTRLLNAREFHQISGRAGRAGFDTAGDVVVLAPEHMIENQKAIRKAGDDPIKKRKLVKRKAPDGAIHWTEAAFDRLVAAEPELLTSHFTVTNAMLLNVISRPGDAFAAMRHLIEDSHEPRDRQLKHARRALEIARGLLRAGIVERLAEPDETGRRWRLTTDLQLDFALNQPLSPLALAALAILDVNTESYALDVVSLIEATLDNPNTVLSAQRHLARGEVVAQLKYEGVEYEERMVILDDVDYPKPLAELIQVAYDSYRVGHPWINDFEPQPKSIVRDMYERAMNFTEYIAFYALTRSEGVLLRYLSDAFQAMRRTVPVEARTDDLGDLIAWLGELVRGVDSSLLDEWDALAHPEDFDTGGAATGSGPRPPTVSPGVTGNPRAFTIMVRNALFRRVEYASLEQYEALGALDDGWNAARWEEAMDGYWQEYEDIGSGPDARSAAMITIRPGASAWHVRQVFDDPDGDRDWGITAEIDVAASDEAGQPVLAIVSVGPLGGD